MRPLRWEGGVLKLLDQTALPVAVKYIECTNYKEVADAIRQMRVRGAPAIGVAAAFGVVLAAMEAREKEVQLAKAGAGSRKKFVKEFIEKAMTELAATRPTAVNLFWALEKMRQCVRKVDVANCQEDSHIDILCAALEKEALELYAADLATNQRMAEAGNKLIPPEARILTHCNTGALATTGYGTALGIIRAAHAAGKKIHVWVDETRPLLQGSRLTAWELLQEKIPATLIADNMAGYLMQQGMVDLVLVGADRIAANGDVVNKIGTYSLAVLAQFHGIPFYVVAPTSTIDLSVNSGKDIPIEVRNADELRQWQGVPTAPAEMPVYNPAFDVTPHYLISAIVTDVGVIYPPYAEGIVEALKAQGQATTVIRGEEIAGK